MSLEHLTDQFDLTGAQEVALLSLTPQLLAKKLVSETGSTNFSTVNAYLRGDQKDNILLPTGENTSIKHQPNNSITFIINNQTSTFTQEQLAGFLPQR